MKRILASEKGAVTIITALAFILLCGAVALTIDVGQLYIARQVAQNAVDAAAMAGISGYPDNTLMDTRATEYANANKVMNPVITHSDLHESGDNKKLTVTGSIPVQFTFARVFGYTNRNVSAKATAMIDHMGNRLGGLVPFGLTPASLEGIQAGTLTTLKFESWRDYENMPGNFGLLALDASGGREVRDNIREGVEGTYSVGDIVPTKPGGTNGDVRMGVEERIALSNYADYNSWVAGGRDPSDARVIIVPVIQPISSGGINDVKILAFASFFLESTDNGKTVTGKFVEMVASGTAGGIEETGLTAPRLIE